MFKTETELQLELFPRNWTETETEIMSGTEISLFCSLSAGIPKMGTIWGRWTKRRLAHSAL